MLTLKGTFQLVNAQELHFSRGDSMLEACDAGEIG